ncbi:MAG: UpxY family transcription antiterminator [Chitinophagaceae bacterium]
MTPVNRFWYAVKTASRAEKKVADRIGQEGLEVFLPMQEVIKQWSDRKKKIKVPLISGFVFVHITESEIAKLHAIQGVVGVLRYLNKPAIILPYEISNLKILINEKVELENCTITEWLKGDSIYIESGVFAGLKGKIIKQLEQVYIIVKLSGVGFHFQVKLPSSFARKEHI